MNYAEFKNIVKPWINPLKKVIQGNVTIPFSYLMGIPIITFFPNNTYYIKGNVTVNGNISNMNILATGSVDFGNASYNVDNSLIFGQQLNGVPIINNSTVEPKYVSNIDFIGCSAPVSDVIATEDDLYNPNYGICNSYKYKSNAGYYRMASTKGKSNSNEWTTSISLHPNPAKSSTKLTLEGYNGQKVRIEIYDLLGKSVMTPLTLDISNDSYIHELQTTGFAPGMYYIKASHDDDSKTLKLVVE